jgi:DNA/RNA endonuclease YhcR with UshA esterase domain
MKYVTSFFLTFNVLAAPIQVYHEDAPEEARTVKEIFIGDYQIPEELIVLKGVKNCEELKGGGKLDLSLKNNGDLLVVSVDKSFVNESLKIFQAP